MNRTLIAVLALVLAAPAVSLPTTADAQVLTGRNNGGRAARHRAPRPALSPSEEERLYAAQDQVSALETQIAELQAMESPTDAQRAEIQTLTTRRAEAQQIVTRLEAKRDR